VIANLGFDFGGWQQRQSAGVELGSFDMEIRVEVAAAGASRGPGKLALSVIDLSPSSVQPVTKRHLPSS
jgi:hypothetical protein